MYPRKIFGKDLYIKKKYLEPCSESQIGKIQKQYQLASQAKELWLKENSTGQLIRTIDELLSQFMFVNNFHNELRFARGKNWITESKMQELTNPLLDAMLDNYFECKVEISFVVNDADSKDFQYLIDSARKSLHANHLLTAWLQINED